MEVDREQMIPSLFECYEENEETEKKSQAFEEAKEGGGGSEV